MAKITKSLSKRVDKQTNKAEILFRFIANSTIILRAKSGIFIDPKLWNEKSGELKSATFGSAEVQIKTKLNNLCDAILESFTNRDIKQINKEWLTNVIYKFHNPEKFVSNDIKIAKMTFFELFDLYLENADFGKERKRHYLVLRRALQRYELYNHITLDIHSIDDDGIVDLISFLENEHEYCKTSRYKRILKAIPESRTPRQRGQNTIQGFYKRLRAFYNWCIEKGYTTNSPKKKFKEYKYGTPIYISIDEMRQIEEHNFENRPQLARQRDIFIFQCNIGCRIGDLYRLTNNNIVDGFVQFVPHKTAKVVHDTIEVPLTQSALRILKKYKVEGDGNHPILPFITTQRYNDAIKEIFKATDITRQVIVRNPITAESESKSIADIASSHMARRTFTGNIYRKVKDPNIIGKLTGHAEGSKAFARYRDIDKDMMREAVSLLEH